MDSSQVAQLVPYLSSQNAKVKAEALEIVLQLTGEKENRDMLRQSEVTKLVLRAVPEQLQSQKALSILLNLSQDFPFAQDMIELNGVQRILDNLKENLIEYIKLSHKTGTDDKEKKAKEELLLSIIQLQLLLISNLSREDEVKKRILELNREPEFHGLNFTFMLSWFNHPTISPTFHFFANILANLSSVKETREFISQPKVQLLENIVPSVFSVEPNRRLGCIRTLRNCFFEYEDPELTKYFLNPKIDLLNSVLKCMLFNVIRGLSTDPDLDKELEDAKEYGKKYGIKFEEEYYDQIASLSHVLEEIDLLIDILLVVTNIEQDQHKLEFDAGLMRFALKNVKLIYQSEAIKDKIDVIYVQILRENPM